MNPFHCRHFQGVFDYIEIYYNRVRRHSANGWLSPEAFEQKYFKNLEGSVVHDTA